MCQKNIEIFPLVRLVLILEKFRMNGWMGIRPLIISYCAGLIIITRFFSQLSE